MGSGEVEEHVARWLTEQLGSTASIDVGLAKIMPLDRCALTVTVRGEGVRRRGAKLNVEPVAGGELELVMYTHEPLEGVDGAVVWILLDVGPSMGA